MKSQVKQNPHKRRTKAQNARVKRATKRSGISLIELLIVVVLVAILFFIWFLMSQTQIGRSRDARRKADLERIKISFEDYYNDQDCYPEPDVLLNCRSDDFQPYLYSIPCDPLTGDPYLYVPLEGNRCGGYRVYTALEDQNDPSIGRVGCVDSPNCGVTEPYNYGVSVGVPIVIDNYTPPAPTPPPGQPTPTPAPGEPTPTPPIIYVYACDSGGTCNQYQEGHPYLQTCPVTYPQSNCNNQCGNAANRCAG